MRFDRIFRLIGMKTEQQRYIERLKTDGTFCFIHINKCGGTSVEQALGLPLIHDTAQQRIEKIGRARWDALLSFALVRHPYDKVVSHYKYRVKTNQTGMGDKHIGLSDWVVQSYGQRDPRYYDQPMMFQPCLDWVVDDKGCITVDHILKLETIAIEWCAFCLEAFGRVIELGHHNTTRAAAAPQKQRLNAAATEILRAHFAKDFEAFDYDPTVTR